MSKSIMKIGNDHFLNNIKFSKESYIIYNNIFTNNCQLTYEIFVYFILQVAVQNKFKGYFDQLYVDVIKRKSHYVKQIINNFKTSYLGDNYTNHFIKFFNCINNNQQIYDDKEIFFNRSIALFDFENLIDDFFQLQNEEKRNMFINLCEILYKNTDKIPIKLKNKKRVSFKSNV